MKKYYFNFIVLLLSLLIISCDKGIAPEPEPEPMVQKEGFGGKITFQGQWKQNVTRTHMIIFKNPLSSPLDFSLLNIAYVSLPISYGVTEFNYSTLDSAFYAAGGLSAGSYSYIAVAQQTTEALSLNRSDWFVVGVYYSTANDTVPGKVILPTGKYIGNININCNFDSPPPQPPG